jgi:hypothetical protein
MFINLREGPHLLLSSFRAQDPFYFEHLRQESRYEPGAVPFRVSQRQHVPNENTPARLAKVVANIKLNLAQYCRPVSVPFEAVGRNAEVDEAGEEEAADPDVMRDADDA